MSLESMRAEYQRGSLNSADLRSDPFDQFALWFQQACDSAMIEPNATSLATVSGDGYPLVRTVLLKSFDARGFVFFTNLESRKARHIKENPNVSLLFPGWPWSARSSSPARRKPFPPPRRWLIF
jgi:pyridoxamine 5'-phosphate oxidase